MLIVVQGQKVKLQPEPEAVSGGNNNNNNDNNNLLPCV